MQKTVEKLSISCALHKEILQETKSCNAGTKSCNAISCDGLDFARPNPNDPRQLFLQRGHAV